MKLHKLILAILITGLLGCQGKKNEVNIIGKINGDIPDKVEYTLPINGICYGGFKESVQPDSLGNFYITISVDEPSFVKLIIQGKLQSTLPVESGESYDVNFDLDSKEDNFKITSKNHKGQEAYISLSNPGHIQAGARKFIKDSIASDIKLKLKTAKENEISTFNELFDNGDISEGLLKLVKLDRECYYSAIKGTIALLKSYEESRKNNGVFSIDISNMWSEVFENTPLTTPNLIRSPWYYALVENFLKYNEYTNKSFDKEKLMEIYKQGLIHTHNIEESKKYLAGNILEYYDAAYLYIKCFQKKYENELIALFEEFKKGFPNSEYTKYIEPVVAPVVEFHKKATKAFDEKVIFIDNHENINSLKECVKSLKGKKVYVDVWATWCGPCKAEFEHKAQLKKLLTSKNVEILYISIDRDENESQWKDMIKFYNLEGYHIRANPKLNEDLKKIFDRNGSISIPWYILIDKNGNIIEEHANRPSQIKELEKQINEI